MTPAQSLCGSFHLLNAALPQQLPLLILKKKNILFLFRWSDEGREELGAESESNLAEEFAKTTICTCFNNSPCCLSLVFKKITGLYNDHFLSLSKCCGSQRQRKIQLCLPSDSLCEERLISHLYSVAPSQFFLRVNLRSVIIFSCDSLLMFTLLNHSLFSYFFNTLCSFSL